MVGAVFKCYICKRSKISPISKLSGQQINEAYSETCGSLLHFIDLVLSIPTGSIDGECSFSQVKLMKTGWSNCITDDHLTDLVVQLVSECVSNFNPEQAINRFLTTAVHHVDEYNHR